MRFDPPVGSRRATLYGRRVATGLASGLASRGIEIVSGGAHGIDTCAHKGAREVEGRTLAVLGSGFHRPYPEENAELFERIADSGAVITEFPLETDPRPDNFPRRNRVISGLSAATAVVELVLDQLAKAGQLLINEGQISLPGFDPFAALSEAKRAHLDRLEAHIKDAAMMPPSMGEVIDENAQDAKLAELLIEVGRVLPLYDHKRTNLFLFHKAAIDDAVVTLQAAFPPPAEFRVGDVRAVLNSTRKYMIRFLTWLDRQNITRRAEDMRQMTQINAS